MLENDLRSVAIWRVEAAVSELKSEDKRPALGDKRRSGTGVQRVSHADVPKKSGIDGRLEPIGRNVQLQGRRKMVQNITYTAQEARGLGVRDGGLRFIEKVDGIGSGGLTRHVTMFPENLFP